MKRRGNFWISNSRSRQVVLRLRGPAGTADNLFAWDSGAGGAALTSPTLHLVVEPGKYVIVTNTPVPTNVLTAAAYVVRGTESAKRNGTRTAFPPGVATATPGGELGRDWRRDRGCRE